MDSQTIILIGAGMYVALMLAVGLYVAGKSTSIGDFAVSGRNMSLTVCSISIVATWFGSGPMMGSAAAAYSGNTLEVLRDPFVSGVSLLIAGFFFARTYRRSERMTPVEFHEIRIGNIAGVLSSFVNLIGGSIWLGGVLFAFGVVFEALTGQSAAVGILGGTAVIVFYTMFGGLRAVAATDVLQMVFVVIGVLALFFVVVNDAGGFGNVAQLMPEHAFRLVPEGRTFNDWFTYLQVWFSSGLVAIGVISVVQRAMAARNEQVAQNSFYLAGFGHLSLGLIPVTLGLIASVTMPGLVDPETVIPQLAIAHLHPVAIAIFVGALLAAIMSSADSTLLAAASVFSNNILPLFKPQASDRLRLLVTRAAIPIFGIIAIYVALEVQAVYDLIMDANSVMLVCVVVPFIVGVWWRRANRTGALASMAMGFITWFLAILFAPELPGDLLGLMTGLLTMLIVTPLTQKTDPPTRLLNIDGEEVEMKDRLGTLPLFRRSDY